MSRSVLIIEDSRSFASLVAGTLKQRYQYPIKIAASYAEAEALLKEDCGRYFAAIVDLNLPDAPNGEAVELTSTFKIPAIVFTGQLSEAIREDVFALGVSDYVLKSGPHNIDYVVDAIHRLDTNRKVKVLVVDDSLTARRQIKRFLLTQCYQVFEADSGLSALGVLEEHPDISITITDCHMDGMDGFELTKTIRETHAKETMAIIGVSSQGGGIVSAQFIKHGADDFIVKPFVQEEFTCRINKNAETLEHFAHLKSLSHQKNFLMGMAAHDIRNPLGIIGRIVKRAMNPSTPPERMNDYLAMIDHSCEGLLELLSDILEVSQLEGKEIPLVKEVSSVEPLLNERINLVATQSEDKNIKILRDFQPSDNIPLDQKRISQVIDNLISNALKYSPKESEITVTVKNEQDSVVISILDQGPGIEQNEQKLLFEAFSQLSTQPTAGESSTGLGLAICKSIVEAHGGNISYERLKGEGSRFYFSLPLTSVD